MTNQDKKTENTPVLYRFASNAGRWVFLLFSALLLVTGLFSSAYIEDILSQKVLYKWGFSPLIIPVLFLFAGLCLLLKILSGLFRTGVRRILLFVTIFWILAAGTLISYFGRTVPAADAMTVYSMAESAAHGDLSFIAGAESYLSYYPQQIGMVTALILPIRVWDSLNTGIPAYHMLKLINTLLAAMMVLFQYYTLKVLLKGKTSENLICCIYLVLAGANLPLLLYTSFLYGEIPSSLAVSAAVYFLSLLVKENRGLPKTVQRSVCFVVFTALAVFLRKNALIFVIALSIVLFFEFLRTKKLHFLILFAASILCSLAVLPLVLKIYESIAGREVLSGVTALSYIAMGMQEAERGYGWYNGFNFNTYLDSGHNTALSNEISKAAISESIEHFKADPSYALRFYLLKYISQWSDGTYASRQATWAEFGGRSAFMQSLYTGNTGRIFTVICDNYQSLIYAGTFLSLLTSLRRDKDGRKYEFYLQLGILYVFGGFLFHMLWEANSRYIFPYSIFLMPYAAFGFGKLFDKKPFRLGTKPFGKHRRH